MTEYNMWPSVKEKHKVHKPEYKWEYANDKYLNSGSDKISNINYIANKYMNFKNRLNRTRYGGNLGTPIPEIIQSQSMQSQTMQSINPTSLPQVQNVQQMTPMTTPSITPVQLPNIEMPQETLSDIPSIPFTEKIDEKPRLKNDCSGLEDVPLDYVVSDRPNESTQQPAPLMDDLFSDKDLILEINDVPSRELPEINQQEMMRDILKQSSLPVNKSDLKLVVSPLLSVENVIRTKDEEIGEGTKIISWLMQKLNIPTNKGVNGLEFKIHKGYVHVFRKHIGTPTIKRASQYITPQPTISVQNSQTGQIQTGQTQGHITQPEFGFFLGQDVITEQNTPGLKFFKWQYGLPIDYDTLKYILFQNKFQESLTQDKSQLEEAKRILGQEYLIAFQPEPLYVMWFAKRLIECWYADDDLNANIRKIKILINLYRARNTEHNRTYGVLPIIVIYPKYGETSAEIVIKKLLNHFWKQIPAGWKCSQPTYFVRLTNFLYYTNGAIDLKMYHRKVLENSNESIMNRSYKEKYTQFDNATDLGEIKVIDDIDNENQFREIPTSENIHP